MPIPIPALNRKEFLPFIMAPIITDWYTDSIFWNIILKLGFN